MGNGEYVSWSQFKEFQDEQIEHGNRLTALETQMKRIISDIESEKETRSRMNTEILSKLSSIEGKVDKRHDENQRMMMRIWKTIGIGMGIIVTISTLLHFAK